MSPGGGKEGEKGGGLRSASVSLLGSSFCPPLWVPPLLLMAASHPRSHRALSRQSQQMPAVRKRRRRPSWSASTSS